MLLAGLPSKSVCPSTADLPFEIVAAVHRRHGSTLPGKPGPSMSVSMLFVNRCIISFLGFLALRLSVEYFHASLGSISVKKRLRLQAETVFKGLLVKKIVWRGLIGVQFCFLVKP